MLTIEKLRLYEKFGGDADHLTRVGVKVEQTSITSKELGLINSFLQDILLVDKQLASEEYESNLTTQIKANCADEGVIERLYQLAVGRNRARTSPRPENSGIWKLIISLFQKH